LEFGYWNLEFGIWNLEFRIMSTEKQTPAPPKTRLILGGIVFILGFMSPLLIPVVLASDLSTTLKTTLSGLLALGIPEIGMLIAAAILGKEGFSYLKQKLFGFLKRYGPPDTVSRGRYRFGLILFFLPLLVGLLLPYFESHFSFYETNEFYFHIIGDAMLFVSLFVLGGDFWDKLRSLAVYGARAIFPDKEKSE